MGHRDTPVPRHSGNQVFISYRRADSAAAAGRLAAHLRQHFAGVFFDTESIEPGESFPERLAGSVAEARVVLVMMGAQWIREVDEWGQRRLDDPDDWVRREIMLALRNEGSTVIPVLLDGARMPPSRVLPDVLQDLVRRNAVTIGQASFQRDADVLVEQLQAMGLTSGVGDADSRVDVEYRAFLRREHGQPPGLFAEHFVDLETVFIELTVAEDPIVRARDNKTLEDGDPELRGREAMSLRTLMRRASEGSQRRWVIAGEPGAGKSTLARHLAWQLGSEPEGPLVVYAALPRLAADRSHPFKLAEQQLSEAMGTAVADGLEAYLRERSEHPGGVWLLLDGLDELTTTQREWAQRNLTQWAEALREVAIAVFTRPIGFRDLGPRYPDHARIEPLSPRDQDRLLDKWLGAGASEVSAALRRRPALAEACKVPLTLSLLALQARESPSDTPWFPANRGALFRRSVETLLRVGPSGSRRCVKDPDAAWTLLSGLALALQHRDGDAWAESELIEWLRDHGTTASGAQLIGPSGSWETPRQCLEDIAKESGILAPYDGRQAPWRFLHRQFKEVLAAEALVARGESAVMEQAQQLGERVERLATWAEVLGFACERLRDPLALLRKLAETSRELALRVLPEVDGIDRFEALTVLLEQGGGENEGWDGDYLLALVRRWVDEAGLDRTAARGWLWELVTPTRSTLELAYLHYALECLDPAGDVLPERERFFRACGRWPEGGPKEPEWKAIPAGSFVMGSEEGEGHDDERPQHEVALKGFEMAAVPVTNEQYGEFDGEHQYEKSKAKHPVVEVSWWEAYLYCRWLGGGLPTEAQWEYACRARTTTRYWSGDDESDLARVGWYFENSERRTHVVAEKPANAWGLHDMHGNVWEWTEDWFAHDYEAGHDGDRGTSTGNRGISDRQGTAGYRVGRGGGWSRGAVICRSAYRFRGRPGARDDYVGFRPARVIT